MSDKWLPVSLASQPRDGRDRETRNPAASAAPLPTASPLMDMVELAEGVCVYCDLPGATPGGISLTIDGNLLHIRAESRLSPLRGKVHAFEFSDIAYEGKIVLPVIDVDRTEASFSNGLLRVMMPFPAASGPVRIPVAAE